MLTKLKLGLLFLAAISSQVNAATDSTLEERAAGKEVTEAVLRKIAKTIISEDHSFLLRLAYTESRFGESNTTFRTDYYGGIWAVEESVFQLTQNDKLTPQHSLIQRKFNIDWKTVAWKDLLKPMHSGLAASLYFKLVHTEANAAIPQTVDQQADHWIKYYRPLQIKKTFEDDAEDLRNQTRCRGKMDLCIVLDSSGSINMGDRFNYQRAKNFTAQMIESFSLDFTRIGMLVFSDNPLVIFPVLNDKTLEDMAYLARNATYLNSGTRTDKAIRQAIELFNNTAAVEGVPKIMTVFTDGKSDTGSDLKGAIREMANSSIKPVSVGIGNGINRQELVDIALNDTDSVFMLTDFTALQDFLQRITSVACEIPQMPVLNSTYNDSLIQNEKRIYKIEPPVEGITITVSVSSGQTKGYWSHSIDVPSEALNDGVIDGPTFIPAPPGIINATKTRQSEGGEEGEEGEEEEEEPLTNIYVTIQGVEPENNYTLVMTDGDKAGGDQENGASLISIANWAIIIIATLNMGLF